MSVHVLLNLLNELRKSDKMRGLSNILSLFRTEFNKFNNTRAWMLDYIYHMTLKLLKITFLAWKCQYFAIFYATLLWTSLRIVTKSVNHYVFYPFYCMTLYHSQTWRHVIKARTPPPCYDNRQSSLPGTHVLAEIQFNYISSGGKPKSENDPVIFGHFIRYNSLTSMLFKNDISENMDNVVC